MLNFADAILRIGAKTSGAADVLVLSNRIGTLGTASDKSAKSVDRLGQATGKTDTELRRMGRTMENIGTVAMGIGLDRLVGRLLQAGRQSIGTGETMMLLKQRIDNVSGSAKETARIMELSEKAAKKFGLSNMEAAKQFTDVYSVLKAQGIQTKTIENMYWGINNAIRAAGKSQEDARVAFLQSAQAMSMGRLMAQEFNSQLQQIPVIAKYYTKALNEMAAKTGNMLTKEQAKEQERLVVEMGKRQLYSLEDSIREQRRAVEKGARDRTKALEDMHRIQERNLKQSQDKETRMIQDRYDKELQMLSDKLNKERRLRDRAADDRNQAEMDKIRDRYEEERKEMQRSFEDIDRYNRTAFENMSEEQVVIFQRAEEDRRKVIMDEIGKREEEETKSVTRRIEDEREKLAIADRDKETKLRRTIQDRQRIEEQALTDKYTKEIEAMETRQRAEMEKITKAADIQKVELDRRLKEQTKMIQEETKKQQAIILSQTVKTEGELKRLVEKGVITRDIQARAYELMAKEIKAPKPGSFQEFSAEMSNLSTVIGEKLYPKLTPLVRNLTKLLELITSLPSPLSDIIVGVAALTLAVGALGLALAPVVLGLGRISGLKMPWAKGLPGQPPAPPRMPPKPPPVMPWQQPAPPPPPRSAPNMPWNRPPGGAPPPPPRMGGPAMPPLPPAAPPPIRPWAIPPGGAPPAPPRPPAPPTALAGLWEKVLNLVKGFIAEIPKIFPQLARLGSVIAGLKIGATISGWLGAVGPFVAGVKTGITGLATWLTGTGVPALVAFATGPVGLTIIGVAAITAAMIKWREPISNWMLWLGKQSDDLAKQVEPGLEKLGNKMSEGILKGGNDIEFELEAIKTAFGSLQDDGGLAIENLGKKFKDLKNDATFEIDVIKKFFTDLWSDATKKADELLTKARNWMNDTVTNVKKGLSDLGNMISKPFNDGAAKIKNVLNDLMQTVGGAINGLIRKINSAIPVANIAAQKLNFPRLPQIPELPIPRLARGGWFDRATIAEIGEGRDPGGEYAIPARAMPGAVQAWNRGLRGAALVSAMQSPGLAPGRGGDVVAGGNLTVQIPPIQVRADATYVLPSGETAVAMGDVEAMIGQALRANNRAILGVINSGAGRARGR